MKKFIKYTKLITLTVLLTSITGCSDYLSELPDNRSEINSPEKISNLITGAYPDANYMTMAELMSDNALSKNRVYDGFRQILSEAMFAWEDSDEINQDTPTFYWNNCYGAIAQANAALEAIEELEGQYDLDSQKGEALLARAYSHFMLVNFWGKHYDAGTAGSDLGVPYVTEPETLLLKEYKRNTVQEVYDLVEKDMLEGLELVSSPERNAKFHFSKESGYAFATRFYTFKGEWENAVEYASKVLTNPRNEIRNEIELSGLGYTEQVNRYNSSLERANLLIGSTSSWWARLYPFYAYGLRSDSNIFSSNNPLGKDWAYGIFGGGANLANRPKFDEYFRITNQSAGTGFGYTPSVLFGRDEVLLNRAEAYAMLNDFTNSLKDLTDFLSQKTEGFDTSSDILTQDMITAEFPSAPANPSNPTPDELLELDPPYPLTDLQKSFVKAVLDFKQKEFYHEGMRWFDVRRFNIEIVRDFRKDSNVTEIRLEKDDNRRQLQIPESALKSGLTENPR